VVGDGASVRWWRSLDGVWRRGVTPPRADGCVRWAQGVSASPWNGMSYGNFRAFLVRLVSTWSPRSVPPVSPLTVTAVIGVTVDV
jgi:hypothetical protein